MALGVAILAAMIPQSDELGAIPTGLKPSEFALKSRTLMACPHVTGAAAFIKSVLSKWISSMIRSTLMTTGAVAFIKLVRSKWISSMIRSTLMTTGEKSDTKSSLRAGTILFKNKI
ncbi:hypothetical protein F8388_011540 [Cannabis sativa]|nr:hypothetical protein F8388_011540 [Cannabis sativa]